MFDVFNELATDLSLEDNGSWFDMGKGARVLVARSGNRAFSKALSKAVEANKQVLDAEDEHADLKSDELMIDVVARTLLLGWEGISFKGAPMTYSAANAKTLLAVKDFRARVQGFANTFEAFKVKEELAQGNDSAAT